MVYQGYDLRCTKCPSSGEAVTGVLFVQSCDLQRCRNQSKISVHDAESAKTADNNNTIQVQKEKVQPVKRTKRQWTILVLLAFGNFCCGSSSSLQGPFYPREAEMKGITPTQYGFVFGVFQFAVFLCSPIFGKIISIVRPKVMLAIGLFLVGIATVCFGFLSIIDDWKLFLWLSIAIRALEGVGVSGYMTGLYTIVAAEFSNSVAVTYSIMQTSLGVGVICGPTVGGAIYQVGGFLAPFAAVGGVIIVCDIIVIFLLPNTEDSSKEDKKKTGQLLKFWCNLSVLLDAYCIFSTFLCIGFNVTVLEHHIRPFSLSPIMVGVVFVISGAVYAVTAPIWGRLADRTTKTKPLAIIGCLFVSAYLLFFGPAVFIPAETKLWMVIVAVVIFGFGTGGTIVNPFIGALRDTIKRGFPNDLSTYGLVSSLFMTSNSMGFFIGPILTGFLVDTIGLRAASVVLFGNEMLLLLTLVVYSIVTRNSS